MGDEWTYIGTPLKERCLSLPIRYWTSVSQVRRPIGPCTIDKGSSILSRVSAHITILHVHGGQPRPFGVDPISHRSQFTRVTHLFRQSR